ncbi:MAG: hypothetical protein MI975_28230 [Cytophagales bacterium]|nr:hypothetical protein [Cytophagales bacterium]
MKYIRQCLATFPGLLILILSPTVEARDLSGENRGSSGLFGSDEILSITLKTDLRLLLKHKRDDEYQEGEITVSGVDYPIRLKARGNYRRENCSFPPITLNFSKTEFEDRSYNQLKKLKLVNACKMQTSYEQYILREYIIYRTFNIMTDKSFKVRLLKIDYVDSKEKMKTVTRYGFVIEDQHMMAKRLDGVIIKKTGIRDQSTSRAHIVMLSIFHFMIGNTDWQVPRLHNLKLLKLNEIAETAPYVIPYDFDYTGMVDASYAIPSPILGIETLRERLYWGKCYSEQDLSIAINKFLEKKDAIYELYQDFDLFDKGSLKSSIDYLDSFYKIIEDEKKWKHYFVNNCRKN